MKKLLGVLVGLCLLAGLTACDAVDTDILPVADDTYDIGSPVLQWADGHFTGLFIGGVPVGPGAGNVVGSPPSDDHAIARYDGITGLLIQNSGVTISDAGVIEGVLGRSATLTVAASDSLAVGISQADYACSGAADDVEINAALNALPANGGRVVLLEGTYTLADPIVIPSSNITLEGQGVSSFINGDGLADTEHAIVISSMEAVWIRYLSVQTENGGGKDSSCILIEDASHDFVVTGVVFVESDSDAIRVGGTSIWGGTISGCSIVDADNHGVHVDSGGGSSTRYIQVSSNLIERVGGDGIHFGTTGSHDYIQIVDNVLQNTDGSAIWVGDLNGGVINSNNMHAIGGYGIYLENVNWTVVNDNSTFNTVEAGIYLSSCDSNNVVGNNIDSTLSADTEDGIYVSGHSNIISSNYIIDTERSGVYIVGDRNIISGNMIRETHLSGIDIRGSENSIEGNVVYEVGQKTAGTYHGIVLSSDADRCSVVDNLIYENGTTTEDGIHLDDGAHEVQISGNYIYNLMGSGVVLTANSDDCQVTDNYIQECDDYGVEIAASCDGTLLIGNRLQGNVTGQILDNGTDTGTFFEPVTLVDDGKCIIRMRPVIDQGKIGNKGKPVIVYYGIVKGYEMPIYALDQEIFFTVPHVWERWDGESDFIAEVHGYLDTANTDKRFRMQLTWEHNLVDGIIVNTSNEVEIETLTGTWAQYQAFELEFTIDYDIDGPGNEIVPGCLLSCRLIREAKTGFEAEITGNVVITGIDIAFVKDKLGAPVP